MRRIAPDEMLTDAELAIQLGVSPRPLGAWRQRGEGPPWIKINRRTVRYRRADVEKYLTTRTSGRNAA